mmetsp:Transcript_6202/g.8940  ORF Transcript_6202/g.8940 Transcript_6202/m.8940 type:complete len:174 (-) Transcript_6202:107-628(-)
MVADSRPRGLVQGVSETGEQLAAPARRTPRHEMYSDQSSDLSSLSQWETETLPHRRANVQGPPLNVIEATLDVDTVYSDSSLSIDDFGQQTYWNAFSNPAAEAEVEIWLSQKAPFLRPDVCEAYSRLFVAWGLDTCECLDRLMRVGDLRRLMRPVHARELEKRLREDNHPNFT